MLTIREALSRLGQSTLEELIGPGTIDVLNALRDTRVTSYALADLLLTQQSPVELLATPAIRTKLFDALPLSQAERLANWVGVKGDSPFGALRSLTVRRGSTTWRQLCEFFEVSLDQPSADALPPSSVSPRVAFGLFDHQRRAAMRALTYLRGSSPAAVPRVLLHMPTGAGKTRTAMHIVADFLRRADNTKASVVWLAYSEELCEQGAREFEKAWSALGDREVTLYRHFGPHRTRFDDVGPGLLVGSLSLMYQQSLTEQSSFFALARRLVLVVMDEAHQAVAPTYQHLLDLLTPGDRTPLLGLSATPGRSWLEPEEDLKLADYFARQKVTLDVEGYANPVEYLQDEGYLAKVDYHTLDSRTEVLLTRAEARELDQGFDLPTSVLKRLGEDQRRNILILQRIAVEAKRRGKILVFACSVDHAELLAGLLRVQDFKAAAISSRTDKESRRRLIEAYRDTDDLQILTNYGVLTTGFDAPRTNVAVITRPTRSVVLYSQMIGRAARGRLAGGNAACRIVTVVDRIPGFRSPAEAFSFWDDIWVD